MHRSLFSLRRFSTIICVHYNSHHNQLQNTAPHSTTSGYHHRREGETVGWSIGNSCFSFQGVAYGDGVILFCCFHLREGSQLHKYHHTPLDDQHFHQHFHRAMSERQARNDKTMDGQMDEVMILFQGGERETEKKEDCVFIVLHASLL